MAKKGRFIGIRISDDEYKIYEALQRKIGAPDLSSFIRWCVMAFNILMSSPLYEIIRPLDEITELSKSVAEQKSESELAEEDKK